MTHKDNLKIQYYSDEALKAGFCLDDYNDWIDFGLAFASMGEDGRYFFHLLSECSPKYDFTVADEKYTELLSSTRNEKTIGSFIRHCTEVLRIPKYRATHTEHSGFTKPESTATDVSLIWKDRLIESEPPDDIPLIPINDVNVLIQGNHTVIVGKKKSRKTLFLVWLISRFNGQVLFFDTEQGKKHVWAIRQKVKQLNDSDLPVFFLRGMSPKDRRDFIYQTVKHWPVRPQVIVIDGIRDLMSNINDPDESTELIVWLEALIREFNLGVLNVLHLNKTDNNARGHIGTELGNKAYMVIEIEKDGQTGVSLVKCSDSRDEPFEPFAFTHGADGLPEIVGMPIKGKVLTDQERKNRLKYVFDGQLLKYAELVDGVKEHFEVGINKAGQLIAEFIRMGWIMKNGKDRSKDAVYKLID